MVSADRTRAAAITVVDNALFLSSPMSSERNSNLNGR
jgi:hypothetical protein